MPFVLVLGGTGFMGRALVEQLAASPHPFVTLNRGTLYWAEHAAEAPPYEGHIFLDWNDGAGSVQKAMRDAMSKVPEGAKAVVGDFSCCEPNHMRDVTKALHEFQHRVQLYVYISTDSVYSSTGLESVSEESPTWEVRNEKKDMSYGEEKCAAEAVLRGRLPDVRRVVLRLPDVVGPYDRTGRYWATLLWAQSPLPLFFPRCDADRRISVVFAADVVGAVMSLICHSEEALDKLVGPEHVATFHLACAEQPTLRQWVCMIVRSAVPLAELVEVAPDFAGPDPRHLYDAARGRGSPHCQLTGCAAAVASSDAPGLAGDATTFQQLCVTYNKIPQYVCHVDVEMTQVRTPSNAKLRMKRRAKR